MDFREEVAGAARDGKRLQVYFGQDGCPYCKALMQTNFSQKEIVYKTRRNFVAIAVNIWGEREVRWIDGRRPPKSQLARRLRVQFTPTIFFLDERGEVVAVDSTTSPDGWRDRSRWLEHLKPSVRDEASA